MPLAQKALLEQTITKMFADDDDLLKSFIRNTDKFEDPTPDDGKVTPADAAAWYIGYIKDNPVYKEGWDKKPDAVFDPIQKNIEYISAIKGAYTLGQSSAKGKGAVPSLYFQQLGLKNARWQNGPTTV